MKAKYSILVLSIFLAASSLSNAQRNGSGAFRNDIARPGFNNYYNDFSFVSRINRFHRPYVALDYFSPVFTGSYGFNFHPFTWGLGIYGGLGPGLGFSLNYPLYGYGYNDYYGYDPYFDNNYYLGYDPFYYNYWYSPFMFSLNFNFNFWNRWWYYGNHGWNGMYRYHRYNDFRRVNYAHNNYRGNSSDRYSSSGYTSRRNPVNNSQSSVRTNNVSRRVTSTRNYQRNIYAGLNNNGNALQGRSYSYRPLRSGTIVRSGSSSGYSRSSGPIARSGSSHISSGSSGSGFRSSSSHSYSRSSGTRSGSSGGRSSGRR
jgi:hypothetical protein